MTLQVVTVDSNFPLITVSSQIFHSSFDKFYFFHFSVESDLVPFRSCRMLEKKNYPCILRLQEMVAVSYVKKRYRLKSSFHCLTTYMLTYCTFVGTSSGNYH